MTENQSETKITLRIVSDEKLEELEAEKPDGWHKIADYDGFLKWQYKDTPYRVYATLDESRGHWVAAFTSSFSHADRAVIRGNLGGGKTGKRKAIASAKNFLENYSNGCPPPGEIEL